MYSTYFDGGNVSRSVVSTFGGINRRARIADGEFADMQNMSADAYPLLAPRAARTMAQRQLTETKTETVTDEDGVEQTVETTVHKSLNGILGDVGFCAVWGTDFYYLGKKIEGLSLIDGEKRLVAFGANILIYPDQKYYNAVNGESGAMETAEAVSGSATYGSTTVKAAEWLTLKGGETIVAVDYSGDSWFSLQKAYNLTTCGICFYEPSGTKSHFQSYLHARVRNGVLEYLYSGTAIWTSGGGGGTQEKFEIDNQVWKTLPVSAITTIATADGYLWNGDFPIAIAEGKLLLGEPGRLDAVFSKMETDGYTLTCTYNWTKSNLPRLDHVCVLDNRVWGCRYGKQAGSNTDVNEIYCTKLGKFNDFTTGTTADSAWTASVGAYGKWTGCISLNGRALFFKEDKILRVSGTKPANFQITEISDIGLQAGCERSMQIIDGVLYYKSRDGVYAYDGSIPTRISDSLGDVQMAKAAVAGSIGGKYYIALDGVLYVYDTRTGLWHKEDKQNIRFFTRYGGSLYAAIDNDIVCIVGQADAIFSSVEAEKAFEWSAESGDIGLDSPYQKYYKRFLIRASGEVGAEMSVCIEADGDEQTALDYVFDGMQTVVLPIATPRCDHMRVKINGHGAVKIYSVSYETETVGDMPERR